MAHILAVGIATLDMVFNVSRYPEEDEEMRADSMRVSRGGNATNTLVVLSQLGHACSWGGVLAESLESHLIVDDLARHEIDFSACPAHAGRPPTSAITLSRETGSRTIVHYRDLPEFSYADFERIVLLPIDWIHFEGRNVAELEKMLNRVKQIRPDLKISIEAEKIRTGLEAILPMADLLLCSKVYAKHNGFDEPQAFLEQQHQQAPGTDVVLAWGDMGAYGMDATGRTFESPAYPPLSVVDTLGAGDVFNAAVIDAYVRRLGMGEALEAGCRRAGYKCGVTGLKVA